MTKLITKSKDLEIKLTLIMNEYGYNIMEALIHFAEIVDKEPVELKRILNSNIINQFEEYAKDKHLLKKGDDNDDVI